MRFLRTAGLTLLVYENSVTDDENQRLDCRSTLFVSLIVLLGIFLQKEKISMRIRRPRTILIQLMGYTHDPRAASVCRQ